jgi:hypothetical protein
LEAPNPKKNQKARNTINQMSKETIEKKSITKKDSKKKITIKRMRIKFEEKKQIKVWIILD